MDLVELIKVVDDVRSKVRLQERTPGVIPVTAFKIKKHKQEAGKTRFFVRVRKMLKLSFHVWMSWKHKNTQ